MSKAAIVGLTKGLARDLGPRGITVNNVQPGPVNTDMNPADGPLASNMHGMMALGRHAHPDEIAGMGGYVGEYRGRSVDTITQLALLDDNTFCFAVTGGVLDMLMAGRWKAEGGGVRLQQVRPDQTLFPAYARKVAALGAMVEFDFHGPTLSSARAPVFAVSADDKAPATLRPLFGPDHSSWSENYPLPPLPAEAVRYFYLGDVVEEAPGKPAVVKVVQYRLDGANSVRVGFDPLQALPLMSQRAELKGDMLFLSGSRLGRRRALDREVVQAVRTGCIAPALNPGAPRPAPKQGETPPLEPLRTFTVSPSAIQGTPFFEAKSN